MPRITVASTITMAVFGIAALALAAVLAAPLWGNDGAPRSQNNQVTKLTVVDVTPTTAMLAWPENPNADSYIVAWYAPDISGLYQERTTTATGYKITGLLPKTAYSVILFPHAGYSPIGVSSVGFTTKSPQDPTSTPTQTPTITPTPPPTNTPTPGPTNTPTPPPTNTPTPVPTNTPTPLPGPSATLHLSSTSIVENGGTTTVTARLSRAASEDVTLTVSIPTTAPVRARLSVNRTLTIAKGATASSGTVSITAVDNDIDASNKTISVSATAAGGNVGDPASVAFTITDDDTRGVVVSARSLTLAEADDTTTTLIAENVKTYTIKLSSAPTGNGISILVDSRDTRVAKVSPARLRFSRSNWSVAQTVTVTAVADDIDNSGDKRTVTILHDVSGSGTDYANMSAPSLSVEVTDDDDPPKFVTLSVDADTGTNGQQSRVAEGAGAKTARVTAATTGGVTYTTATTVTVSVGATTDSATEGTDYTTVADFNIVIPGGATSATGDFTLTPTDDSRDENDESVTVSGRSRGVTITGATITIADDDTRGIAIDPASLTLDEADDANTSGTIENQKTYSIKLNSQPYGRNDTVTIALSSGASSVATVSPSQLTFNGSTWNTAQTVTVTAVADDLYNAEGWRTTVISHSVAAPNTDYSTVIMSGVSVKVTDDDPPPKVIILSIDTDTGVGQQQLRVAENGGAKTARVTATIQGGFTFTTATTVAVTVGNAKDSARSGTDYAVVTSFSIVIPSGDTSATGDFTLTPTDDSRDEYIQKVTVSGTATGGFTVKDTTFTITDDDTRGITVSPVSLVMDEADDANTAGITENRKTYTVKLATQPHGDKDEVVIKLSVDSKVATVSPTQLTFSGTTWNTAQTVTVTAVADEVHNADDKRTTTITHAAAAPDTDYSQAPSASVSVEVTDDDEAPLVLMSPVTRLTAAVVTSNSATLVWPENDDADSYLLGWHSSDIGGALQEVTDLTGTSYVLTGLEPDHAYSAILYPFSNGVLLTGILTTGFTTEPPILDDHMAASLKDARARAAAKQNNGTASVVYVLDDSGSMDRGWQEMRSALEYVRDLTGISNTKVALIAFGGLSTTETLFPLTAHASAPWDTPLTGSTLTPITSFGGYRGYQSPTDDRTALRAAATLLSQDNATIKKIVFVTDTRKYWHSSTLERQLKKASIVVDTIYFDTNVHAAPGTIDGLTKLAKATGGTFEHLLKPTGGTTNSPAVAARALSAILEEKAAANTSTLYLMDNSASVHPGDHAHAGAMRSALSAVRTKVKSIATARVGTARFLGPNGITSGAVRFSYRDNNGRWQQFNTPAATVFKGYRTTAGFTAGSSFAVPRFLTLYPTGSTDINSALQEAYGHISKETSTTRRVVLVTDGITHTKATAATLKKYTDANICIDVVSIGDHADRVYLKSLADTTGLCGDFNVAAKSN